MSPRVLCRHAAILDCLKIKLGQRQKYGSTVELIEKSRANVSYQFNYCDTHSYFALLRSKLILGNSEIIAVCPQLNVGSSDF